MFPKEELCVATEEDKLTLENTNFFMEGEIDEFVSKQCIYIYRIDGEYVGLGIVISHPSGDDVLDIGMQVAPKFRGRGIGRSIIIHLTKMCIEKGKRPVAECKIDNIESKATLFSAGFVLEKD